MKMPFKVALTAMLGILSMAFAASFMLTNLVGGDAESVKQSFLLQLRRSARALVEIQSEQLSDRLARLVERELQTPDKITELSGSEFIAVGIISEWVESLNPKINKNWISELNSSLPLDRVKASEVAWVRVATDDGQIYFLLIAELQVKNDSGVQSKLAFGVLPASIFSNINLISKGEKNSVFLVDDQGTAFGYPDMQYVGSKLSNHPFVESLIKTKSIEFTGQAGQSASESVVGGYDKVANTNLYMVVSSLAQSKIKLLAKFAFQIAVVCIAIILIVVLVLSFFTSKVAQQIAVLKKNIAMLEKSNRPESIIVEGGDDRLREFARGVASYLRKPAASIIGLVQIAGNKTEDKSIKESLDKIASETRIVRAFSEALSKEAGLGDVAQEILELNPILSQVVSIVRAEISKSKINYEENLKAELSVRANHDDLKNSIKSIFLFVISRLQVSANERAILVNTEKRGGMAIISFESRGVELNNEDRKKMFMPFETKIPSTRILGLDLSLAQNYIREINGDVEVATIGGDGFRISLSLPTVNRVMAQPQMPSEPELTVPQAIKVELMPPKPVSPEASVKFPPPPQFNLSVEPRNDIQIRKPKLRIDS